MPSGWCWEASTLGIVIGPNLADPAHHAAAAMGVDADTGPYLLCAAMFGLAALGVLVGLRPDPLRLARPLSTGIRAGTPPARQGRGWTPNARLALVTIGVAQLVMVGVMWLGHTVERGNPPTHLNLNRPGSDGGGVHATSGVAAPADPRKSGSGSTRSTRSGGQGS